MRKSAVLILIFTIISSFMSTASAGQSYSIKYAGDYAQWGNSCSTAPGLGWFCVAEVQVKNLTGKMINPRLTAELVDTKGRKYTARDNSQNNILTGIFQNNYVNPSETVGWAINFSTGANVKFSQLNIYEGRKKVASLRYTCASTISGAFC